MQRHVSDKGWYDIEHYWGKNGVCIVDKDFGVEEVPHCVLVDSNGMVVFVG